MNTVAPWVAGGSALGMVGMAPGAVTAFGQYGLAAIHSSAHGDKFVKGAQIAEAFLNPNAPTVPSGTALIGTAAARAIEWLQQKREQKK